ncbi:MAG: A/G-specific adenine glycosylase [Bacteroidota bacterium]
MNASVPQTGFSVGYRKLRDLGFCDGFASFHGLSGTAMRFIGGGSCPLLLHTLLLLHVPSPAHLDAFHNGLLDWYKRVRRDMPWRRTSDPYRIWLSEVMLQQTRVDQATPYYERFVGRFPTVEDLAGAPIDDVLKAWEGLGYYSRARNLHRAAQAIAGEHAGVLPGTEDQFRALPGVGPYTSAAVLSIAYGVPLAVLDGNVIRVLTRIFAISDDVKKGRTRRRLQDLATELLNHDHPGDHNQAVMELGATVCTPRNPDCSVCPVCTVCAAHAAGTPTAFPVASKKKPVPHHDIAVGLVSDASGRLLINRRPEDAMLGGLWEFPGGKREPGEPLAETCRRELQEELGIEVEVTAPFYRLDHAYSHFKITLHAFRCRLVSGTPKTTTGMPIRWVTPAELDDYAFPRANRRLIEELQRRETAPGLFD